MFIEKAYAKRASLSDRDLGRLADALREQIDRYKIAIQNYPPERMESHGTPFLKHLQGRLDEVNALIARRAEDAGA
ncbi:hypothetical protein BWQ93_00140 [Sphingopyxis sp. QXT-31]|uniref:hypothetical protein n=1 Tax=Sphingopyxis sp. QXT-31 TaxID=1357916 RepID=UPI00097975DA|nr:hypothetical protein [Sphingopyxis sp. QXT-31]APZ97078.1 hypothetical protein BWQ93_00140 [Sphingopyxis sp. QXT-31]